MLSCLVILIILLSLAVWNNFLLKKKVFSQNAEFQDWRLQQDKRVESERADAVKKSRAVIKGHVSENLCPFGEDFPYITSDIKALFQPVDLIIFKGMSNGEIEEIIFLDIKTGVANLSPIQRKIKKAVEEKRVRFETFRAQSFLFA